MSTKKKIWLTPLFLTAILAPTIVHAQSLEQAVAAALDSHPDLRIALSKFKVAEEQAAQAKSGYLPTIDLTAGYGYEQTDSPATRRGINAADDGQAGLKRGEFGLSLKQIIFDGFYTSNESSRTEFEASAEQWSLFASAEDIALSVAKSYTSVLEHQEVLSLSQKNLKAHQDIYAQIKERTDSGLGSVADLSQVTGRLARANVNVISATNNYRDSVAQFTKLVNQQPNNLVIPVPDADMLPENKESGLQQALANHPIIKSATNDIESARFAKESAGSTNYPTITFELDANLNNNTAGEEGIDRLGTDVGGHNNNATAMLRLKYNLYSGNKNTHQKRAAAYRITEAVEINTKAHRDVTEGYTLAWNAFELLAMQKNYIRKHVESSKETQTAYEQQFRLGQRSLLDVLDTENELFEARKDFLSAEYQEINAQYRLFNSAGKLLESLRVTPSPLWLGDREYSQGAK